MSTLSCQRRRQGQHWRGIQLCGVRGRGSTGFVRHQSDQSEFVATVPVTDERLRSDLGGSRCARAQVWHSTNSRSFVCLTYGQASYPGSGTWPLRELFSATLFSELYWKSFWRASCSYAWLLGKFLCLKLKIRQWDIFGSLRLGEVTTFLTIFFLLRSNLRNTFDTYRQVFKFKRAIWLLPRFFNTVEVFE